jgi:sucrose-6-phosphate hydrolase SacC (GH32 family)
VRIYYDDQHWTEIGFDRVKGEFYIDRTRSGETSIQGFAVKTTAPLAPGRPYNAKLIVDRSSLEAFAQNGTIAMTDLVYPPTANNRVVFFPSGADPLKFNAHLWKLGSIWRPAVREQSNLTHNVTVSPKESHTMASSSGVVRSWVP